MNVPLASLIKRRMFAAKSNGAHVAQGERVPTKCSVSLIGTKRFDEIQEENENPLSISNQQKVDNLRLQEMENRVCESQLRCQAQRLIINKAEEEYKHLQEMNEKVLRHYNIVTVGECPGKK